MWKTYRPHPFGKRRMGFLLISEHARLEGGYVLSYTNREGLSMRCYILSRKKTGEVVVMGFDDFLLACSNTGHGPYSFYPTRETIQEVLDSQVWLPPWEDLQEFEYENLAVLLYKISVLRQKGQPRKPTLH